jgi:hypothetical protein
MDMEYCFHHIPKTAGSSLQLRLAHRESVGQLPSGSTLVVYPLYDSVRFYRVSEDPDFDCDQPIKDAFYEHINVLTGRFSINCVWTLYKYYTTRHTITWLRDPLARDVSHFNYDC